jgi:hypothetical protein
MSQSVTQSPPTKKAESTKLPAKLGKNLKKIKRQVSRVFHHVTLPKRYSVAPITLPVVTTNSPSTFPPSNIIHIFHHSGRRRDSLRKNRDAHLASSDRTSSQESLAPTKQSSQDSIASTSYMSVEHSLAQEVPSSMSFPPADTEDIVHDGSMLHPSANESQAGEVKGTPVSSSEPMFTSPPTVYVEPEVPDPFLIDDEDSSSDEGRDSPTAPISSSQQTITPSHEISLNIPASPSMSQPTTPNSIPLPSSNMNKDVPPPPTSDSDPDEDEAPDLYLPGLVIPTMFLPIPNVRRPFSSQYLTWWLSRSLMYHTCTRRIL